MGRYGCELSKTAKVDQYLIKFLQQTSQDPSSNQDQTVLPSSNHIDSTKIPTIVNNDIRDGWDNDEWGSLEEEPVIEELEEKLNDMNHHSPASRSNSNSHSSSGNHHNNNHNSVSPSKDNGSSGGDNMLNSNSNSYSNSNWDNHGTSWNDDEFEPIDDSNGGEFGGLRFYAKDKIK